MLDNHSWQNLAASIQLGDKEAVRRLTKLLNAGLHCILNHRGVNEVHSATEQICNDAIEAIRHRQVHDRNQFTAFVRARVEAVILAAKRQTQEDAHVFERNSEAVNNLSDTEREILIRCYTEGQNDAQVCQEMGLNPEQFAAQKASAKARLSAPPRKNGSE